ncbi:MAG: hypothetical protein GY952_17475 [Rhodobacteraceae bacterium]|nr:hypothetical protein [Paracoccaceae bacterium]
MRILLAALLFAAPFQTAEAEPAGGFISLSAAEKKCGVRAQKFADSSFGRYAEHPEPYLIWQRYRACVYANSRQYPSYKPDFRGRTLFRLNKVIE